jgi:cobalt/nickel transport system permease protein
MSLFKKNNFLERSIIEGLSFLKDAILSQEYSKSQGFLQSLDPRLKTVSFLLFIVSVMILRDITPLLYMYGLCLFLAYASGIRLFFFLKRTWVFIPLFSLFIAIPALFNFFSPGEALFYFKVFGARLIVTKEGLLAASLFCLRVVTSVSLVILLSLTTSHSSLLKTLRTLGVPQIFVLTISMCYRYIYLFVEIIQDTYLAVKSRVGTAIDYKKGQGMVAANIANLWQRSVQLNEQVYQAMLSRGYAGEPKLAHGFKARTIDWIWLSVSIFIFAGIFLRIYVLKM